MRNILLVDRSVTTKQYQRARTDALRKGVMLKVHRLTTEEEHKLFEAMSTRATPKEDMFAWFLEDTEDVFAEAFAFLLANLYAAVFQRSHVDGSHECAQTLAWDDSRLCSIGLLHWLVERNSGMRSWPWDREHPTRFYYVDNAATDAEKVREG